MTDNDISFDLNNETEQKEQKQKKGLLEKISEIGSKAVEKGKEAGMFNAQNIAKNMSAGNSDGKDKGMKLGDRVNNAAQFMGIPNGLQPPENSQQNSNKTPPDNGNNNTLNQTGGTGMGKPTDDQMKFFGFGGQDSNKNSPEPKNSNPQKKKRGRPKKTSK